MLKHSRLATCLVLAVLVVSSGAADDKQDASQASATTSAIEKEIRAGADSFVAAFKKRDAAAIAAHWTTEGVYIDEEGQRFVGRKSIQAEYEKLFENISEEVELRIEIDAVRSITPQTAMEEGRVALAPQSPGAARVMSRYTAVHIKQDGQWLMADVRDTRVELPPEAGQVEDLEWLVGTWSAGDEKAHVEVKCRRIENDHFLARSHRATESGKATSSGLEIIGLDPFTGRITSWSFTGDGGHAVGVWSPHESGWIIESVAATKDGTTSTATYMLSRKDAKTLLWKSGNRTVGDTLLPDTDEVALTRE